jgi:hypothetical protein
MENDFNKKSDNTTEFKSPPPWNAFLMCTVCARRDTKCVNITFLPGASFISIKVDKWYVRARSHIAIIPKEAHI